MSSIANQSTDLFHDSSDADYDAILSQFWNQATAPRSDDAPTVISTFAGAGGSSLGYHAAGFEELLAVDWNEHAAECFARNFDVPYYCGDISDLSGEEVRERAGLQRGELDLLDGSPPCQGFSTAGNRNEDDERNTLFLEFKRFLDDLHPKVFVMENVSGMVRGKMKPVFREILQTLRSAGDSGYSVAVKELNAKYLGVPQNRTRIIFVGVRQDISESPVHPSPQTRPRSIRESIRSVTPRTYIEYESGSWSRRAWSVVDVGKSLSDYSSELPDDFVKDGSGYSYAKPDPSKSAPTILKQQTFRDTYLMYWGSPRSYSVEEVQALTSFPSEYDLFGDFEDQWRRIGNSVPPLMMYHIAKSIRSGILKHL